MSGGEALVVTVDGRPVPARPGQTILDVIRERGLGDVPTLCDWSGLPPWGGCGVCAVEVAGRLVPACETRVAAGMRVASRGAAVERARRTALALLLEAHGGACAAAEGGEPCTLCTLARAHGLDPGVPRAPHAAVDESHASIRFDRNGCVLCARCVRACAAVAGPAALALAGRGPGATVLPGLGRDLAEGGCDGCGACAEVCPTGARGPRHARAAGASPGVAWVRSTCALCGLTCPIEIGARGDGAVVVRTDAADPVPTALCGRGRLGPGILAEAPRLAGPVVLDRGVQVLVPWPTAFQRAATLLQACAARHGPDAVLVAVSASLPLEAAWAVHQVAREGLGTTQVGSLRVRPREDLSGALGWTRGTARLADLEHADLVLVVGADLAQRHPAAAARVRAAGRRGACVVLVHPDPLDLGVAGARRLDALRGTRATLLAAVLDQLEGCPSSAGLSAAAATCGLDPAVVADLAARIALARRVVALYDLDAPSRDSEDDLALLARILARRGDLDGGLLLLREEAGASAAARLGLDADLPGILRAGGVRGALVVGEDPLADPEQAPFLRDLDALVVLAAHPGPTACAAHAVLPISPITEQEGTFLGLDGRLLPLAPLPAPRCAKGALAVLAELAAAMGGPVPGSSAAAVRAALALEHGLDPAAFEHLRAARAPWPARLVPAAVSAPAPPRPIPARSSRPSPLARIVDEGLARLAERRNP